MQSCGVSEPQSSIPKSRPSHLAYAGTKTRQDLIRIIWALCCQFHSKLEPHYALTQPLRCFLLHIQKCYVLNIGYHKDFEAVVETIKTKEENAVEVMGLVQTRALKHCKIPVATTWMRSMVSKQKWGTNSWQKWCWDEPTMQYMASSRMS